MTLPRQREAGAPWPATATCRRSCQLGQARDSSCFASHSPDGTRRDYMMFEMATRPSVLHPFPGRLLLPLRLLRLLLPMMMTVMLTTSAEEPEWLGDPSCPYFVETFSYFPIYNVHSHPVDVGFRKARFFPQAGARECRADLGTVLDEDHASLRQAYRAYLLKVENASYPDIRVTVSWGNATANMDVVAELAWINCVPTVDSVRLFAEVADLRVYATYEVPLPEGNTPEEKEALCNIWRGLRMFSMQNMRTVNLSSLASCGVPLTNMSHVLIGNSSMTDYPEGFSELFPNISNLELDKNKLTKPPMYLWSEQRVKFFRNLTLSPGVYDDYTKRGILSTGYDGIKKSLSMEDNVITDLEDFEFQGCLELVSLKRNRLQRFSENTFANLSCLRYLDICSNNLTEIPADGFTNMSDLLQLELCDNELQEILPAHLSSMPHLRILNLANNRIAFIQPSLFQQLHSLEEVLLQGNLLTAIPEGLLDQSNLTTLNLGFNDIATFPLEIFSLDHLQTVSLKNTSIRVLNLTAMCSKYVSGELRLSAGLLSPGEDLRKVDLTGSGPLQVHLKAEGRLCGTAVQAVLCSHEFLVDSLYCGCEILDVATFLRSLLANSTCGKVRQNAWTCASPEELRGRSLLSLQAEETYCPVVLQDCPGACRCLQRAGGARRVIVDCRGSGLRRLPEKVPAGAEVELWLEDNALGSLAPRPYLPRLHTLRVDRNALTAVEAGLLQQLGGLRQLSLEANLLAALPPELARFSRQLSSLRLAANPFRCDCHARWLQTWVASDPAALLDGDAITCNLAGEGGAGVLLRRVPAEELVCVEDAVRAQVAVKAGVASVVVVLVAVGVGAALLFRRQLKLWLYVHTSWHPFDRDDQQQQQKRDEAEWDVGVVCGSGEDAWVWSHVSARLEQEQGLRVLHCWRDFRLGLTYGQNLGRAAAGCRRLLLVLSPEALGERLVGAAVRVGVEAARHRRANFLVLLLHDCDTLPTTGEGVKELLKAGPSISTKDRHFFKKLMYYMPQDARRRETLNRPDVNEENPRIKDNARQMDGAEGKNGVVNPAVDINIEMEEGVQGEEGAAPVAPGDEGGEGEGPSGLGLAMEPMTPAAEAAEVESLPVFVWYGHGQQDLAFVLEQVVGPLRGRGVRWILEDKDFLPGAPKEQNLVRAVEGSRATLVVVSACSLQDEWTLHAFQVALHRQMAGGAGHVVALCVRRDCPEERMDKEMKQFLHSSTPLIEGGPWFKERLLQLSTTEKTNMDKDEMKEEAPQ